MSDLSFETAEIPATVSNRPETPNPFDGKFPSDEKALKVTLPGSIVDEKTAPAIKRVMLQARKAAKKVERTARIKSEVHETGSGKAKKIETVLTIWTVAAIKRPRKNGNDETTVADSTPATS